MTKTKYALHPDMVFRKEEEEALIFTPDAGEVKILNETGVFIYERLARHMDPAEIVDALRAEYGPIDRRTAEADVNAFLQEMVRAGVLRIAGENRGNPDGGK